MWSKKLKNINGLVLLCLLGVVDQIHGKSVHAEITSDDGRLSAVDFPIWMFPCEISEGDMFHIKKTDGVMELRCGEPQE